jgi:hypothetical protein
MIMIKKIGRGLSSKYTLMFVVGTSLKNQHSVSSHRSQDIEQ